MDALALLCTLHADGPASLVRLRAADCTTLERVAAESPERLAEVMRISTLAAARFQREAHNLIERIGAQMASVELAAVPEVRLARPRMLDQVLSTWRERDEAEAQAAVGASGPAMPCAAPAGAPDAIAVGAIDGIDGEASTLLARAGIADLAALARCDALAAARRSGLAYSRVMRLRALAKRAVDSAATRADPAARAPRLADASPVPRVAQACSPKLSPAELSADLGEPLVKFEREFVLQPQAHAVDAGGPFA